MLFKAFIVSLGYLCLNWDPLILEWDSWFWMRWVPGLTSNLWQNHYMLDCGSKAHMGGLIWMGIWSQKAKFRNVLDRKINKQLTKSPLELLPFELGHFRLQELEKKKTNGKFELHAQFTLYATVIEIFMSSALINLQMTFLSSLHINC